MLLPDTSWPTVWEHGMEDTCQAGTRGGLMVSFDK